MRAKLKIGDFVLDAGRSVVCGAEGEVSLELKVIDVLLTLAGRPGEVFSREELIDAVWKADFGADERLTRAISLLRKAFGDERGTAHYIETVTKRGYRLVAPVTVVSPAGKTHGEESVSTAVDAGAPAGERPAPQSEGSPNAAAAPPLQALKPWQVWWPAAIAVVPVVAVALVAALSWGSLNFTEPNHEQDAVELLPFVLIDSKPGLGALAQQLQASLTHLMVSNQITLTDSVATKSERGSGAGQRDSEFVLTGSIERTNDRHAVTLYFDVRQAGETLWSYGFARPIEETDALREEVAATAAHVIRCALDHRRQSRSKESRAAFKAYLDSCDPANAWDNEAKYLALAQRLIEAAPEDSYGYGIAARTYAQLSTETGVPDDRRTSHRAAARKAAAQARELDRTSHFAVFAETWTLPFQENWRAREAYFETTSDPLLDARRIWHLRGSGRLEQAQHVAERAAASTPLSPGPQVARGLMQMSLGQHDTAEHIFESALRYWPNNETIRWYHFVNAAFYGSPQRAQQLFDRYRLDLKDNREPCLQSFIAARVRKGRSDASSVLRSCAHTMPDHLARMLAMLGDVDGAYAVLRNHSFETEGTAIFAFYPEMAAFRRDARFMPFMIDSGLPAFWLETGKWPDFCNDPTLPHDCKTAAQKALAAKARSAKAVE